MKMRTLWDKSKCECKQVAELRNEVALLRLEMGSARSTLGSYVEWLDRAGDRELVHLARSIHSFLDSSGDFPTRVMVARIIDAERIIAEECNARTPIGKIACAGRARYAEMRIAEECKALRARLLMDTELMGRVMGYYFTCHRNA